jgi:putative peptide zinc metalloprotease protein
VFLVSRDWQRFVGTFPHLFSLGALAFGVALFFAKFCHEFGHAFMAKRAGCRVQSMGVAFMVLLPMFYTDVSDAWRVNDRRARLLIGAGGVLAELLLACIALLVWSLLPDGPARTAAFMLASATWITTLVVNLNPFMRFDGYFLLSDLWEVDNLQGRAFAFVAGACASGCSAMANRRRSLGRRRCNGVCCGGATWPGCGGRRCFWGSPWRCITCSSSCSGSS